MECVHSIVQSSDKTLCTTHHLSSNFSHLNMPIFCIVFFLFLSSLFFPPSYVLYSYLSKWWNVQHVHQMTCLYNPHIEKKSNQTAVWKLFKPTNKKKIRTHISYLIWYIFNAKSIFFGGKTWKHPSINTSYNFIESAALVVCFWLLFWHFENTCECVGNVYLSMVVTFHTSFPSVLDEFHNLHLVNLFLFPLAITYRCVFFLCVYVCVCVFGFFFWHTKTHMPNIFNFWLRTVFSSRKKMRVEFWVNLT